MGCLRESIGHRQPTKVAKDAGTVYSDKCMPQLTAKLSLPRFPKQTEEFFRAEKLDKTCCCSYARCNWSTQMKRWAVWWSLTNKETLMLFWNPLNLPLADATKLCEALEACQLCIDELGLHNEISAEAFLEERERRCGAQRKRMERWLWVKIGYPKMDGKYYMYVYIYINTKMYCKY